MFKIKNLIFNKRNMFKVVSLCGNFSKIIDDYNQAVILVNNKKSIFYLGVIEK